MSDFDFSFFKYFSKSSLEQTKERRIRFIEMYQKLFAFTIKFFHFCYHLFSTFNGRHFETFR